MLSILTSVSHHHYTRTLLEADPPQDQRSTLEFFPPMTTAENLQATRTRAIAPEAYSMASGWVRVVLPHRKRERKHLYPS